MRSGYSLLEVLIAFSIMSLVLAVLIPGQAAVLSRSVNSEETLLAADFAASRLDLLGVLDPIEPGQTAETYREWDLTTEVVEVTLLGQGTSAFSITVSVERDGSNLANIETLKSVLQEP